MADWKLIALDIDGTTVPRKSTLSGENRRWILEAKEQGLPVTFATGRHRRGLVEEYVRELKIEVPFVTLNGGEVWTPQGELLARHLMQAEEIRYLYEITQRHDLYYWGATTEEAYNPENFPSPTRIGHYQWIKFGYHTRDVTVLAEIWDELRDHGGFTLSNSDAYNIEVNAPDTDKATGLQAVADYLHIHRDEVAVMGDSLNDIPMFRWAGRAIAVGNAQDAAKEAADEVTVNAAENAVAVTIQQLLDSR